MEKAVWVLTASPLSKLFPGWEWLRGSVPWGQVSTLGLLRMMPGAGEGVVTLSYLKVHQSNPTQSHSPGGL